MNIAICDDAEEYRLSLKCYTAQYFEQQQIQCNIYDFANGKSLIESDCVFDIVFLDIELGDINGIDVAKEIQSRNKNTVILIVTSYRKYLDDAMDINVSRYIDKPINQDKIFSALDKAVFQIKNSVVTLHLKSNSLIRININEIIYAEAKLKKVTVYTTTASYEIKENMKQLVSILISPCFAIPHGSYIVNLDYITFFKRNEIELRTPNGNQNIMIASRRQTGFRSRFLNYIGEDFVND